MSENNDPKPDGKSVPVPSTETSIPKESNRVNLNEHFEKAKSDSGKDIQKGFDFETKPAKPIEKPKTDSTTPD